MSIQKFILVSMVFTCFSALAYSPPPAAYPLDAVIKSSEHIFIGKINSAEPSGDAFIYGISVERNIVGGGGKSCLTSKMPYEVGGYYFFFIGKSSGLCMDGGGVLRRGIPLRKFSSVQYAVFQDERYIYPDFGSAIFRVDSVPMEAVRPITLWSGVPVELFESHVRSIKKKKE